MKPRLRKVRDRLRKLDIARYAHDARRQWLFGRRVLAVKNGPDGVYGRHGVVKLAKDLGRGKDYLYERAAIAGKWTAAEIRKIAPPSCGRPPARIIWGHLVVLHRNELTKEVSLRWIKEARKRSWTPRQLSRAIDEANQGRLTRWKRRSKGRTGSRPASAPIGPG